MMLLSCLQLGSKDRYCIQIDPEMAVIDLAEAIQQQQSLTSSDLDLYLAKENGDPHGEWLDLSDEVEDLLTQPSLPGEVEEMYLKRELRLDFFRRVGEYFPDGAPVGFVHVLVGARQGSQKPTAIDSPPVASLGQLKSFIDQPLPTKITIAPSVLADIRRKFDGMESRDVLEKLFVEAHSPSCCKTFTERVVTFNVHADVDKTGCESESSFHFLWDAIIRTPLRMIFPFARTDRGTDQSISTGSGRPDFVFILDSVCVFRGEEAAHGAVSIPRDELCSKLVWTFGDIPYVFTYAACGYECRLFALYRVGSTTSVTSFELGWFRLDRTGDRLRLLLALLQLGRLLKTITSRCPTSSCGEFVNIRRPSGEVIRLDPSSAQKDFSAATDLQGTPVDFERLVDHVMRVYGVLPSAHVPHVDSLVKIKRRERVIVLWPRGYHQNPTTLAELFCALRHVLETLVALHQASWMHRDISWSNVLRRREEDGGGWFLIDFMDAASSPQPSSSTLSLNPETHAPEMFEDGGTHTTAVDLWSVGSLIDESSVNWDDAGPRTALVKRLLDSDRRNRPTAEEALSEMRRLEAEYTRGSARRDDEMTPTAKKAKLMP